MKKTDETKKRANECEKCLCVCGAFPDYRLPGRGNDKSFHVEHSSFNFKCYQNEIENIVSIFLIISGLLKE